MLIMAELLRIRRVLPVSVATTGIAAWDHVVIVADLRGMFGRAVGEALIERPLVEHALRKADTKGIRPSFVVPLPINEALPLLRMCGEDVVERVMTRPPRTMPVLVVDENDNPALAFSDPLGDGAKS